MIKKILIIDDDAELCYEIAEILNHDKCRIEIAPNGKKGKLFLKKQEYDIILLDYRLPDLNGIDILKYIKSKKIKSKIFIMSGRPFIERLLMEKKLSNIVTSVIQKPFNPENFVEKVYNS